MYSREDYLDPNALVPSRRPTAADQALELNAVDHVILLEMERRSLQSENAQMRELLWRAVPFIPHGTLREWMERFARAQS